MQKIEAPQDKNIKLISMHDEMSSSYLSYASNPVNQSLIGPNAPV